MKAGIADCQDLINRGVIDEGMIPKVEACLESLRAGVRKTHMIDGRLRHSLLLEIYTDRGVGTEITLRQAAASPTPPALNGPVTDARRSHPEPTGS